MLSNKMSASAEFPKMGVKELSRLTNKSKPKAQIKNPTAINTTLPADNTEIKPIHKKWTILNYIAADNNLTEFQIKNINDMEAVGSDENTHILTFIDVGPETKEGVDFKGGRLYHITQDNDPKKINSRLLKDYGSLVNSGDYKTLRDFIVYTVKNYPSEHIALFLNDHGGGFTGGMSDDSQGGSMSVPDLRKALEEAQKITGKKITILGFDACLMGELEVAYELKNCADYLLASEENEDGNGWPYTPILGNKVLPQVIKALQEELKNSSFKITENPSELARKVVEVCSRHQDDIPTFAASDLTKIDGLKSAINQFAEAIIKTTEKETVLEAVKTAENYGGGWFPYSDIHDLGHLAENISSKTKDPKLKTAADNVSAALKKVVIANESHPIKHPNSQGLSIYAPRKQSDYMEKTYEALAFASDTKWDEALKSVMAKQQDGEIPKENPWVWPDGSPKPGKKIL